MQDRQGAGEIAENDWHRGAGNKQVFSDDVGSINEKTQVEPGFFSGQGRA